MLYKPGINSTKMMELGALISTQKPKIVETLAQNKKEFLHNDFLIRLVSDFSFTYFRKFN